MTSSLELQTAFSLIAVIVALIGVILQNAALHYAQLGEIPDFGGTGFTATAGALAIIQQFQIDLRTYYRHASSTLSSVANFLLLISVVAGVIAGFTANLAVTACLGVFWIIVAAALLQSANRRRSALKSREAALEERRTSYNERFYRGMAETMGEEYARTAFQAIQPFERVRW